MKDKSYFTLLFCFSIILSLSACKEGRWNNPHTQDPSKNIRYTSFSEPPKTLDPAVSYSTNEAVFISQIYEPVLQYHYLKQPYELMPLTATKMPKVTYFDQHQKILPANASDQDIAFSKYEIEIKPHIFYQPHPAFVEFPKDGKIRRTLSDFEKTSTRELVAEDYVYGIKRLASPKVNSPIAGLMEQYIAGFKDYRTVLQKAGKNSEGYLDLRQFPLAGVKAIDKYHYEIMIKGKYPQFSYWLAMHFFSPIPWEADRFYSQPGMKNKNLTFTWYPIGTGPYMLTENNPNKEMILTRNPNFHGENFPAENNITNDPKMLSRKNQPLPFIDQYIFSLEKESIPRWSKFLQGYYDVSAINSDSFDQAIQINEKGEPQLTQQMKEKKIFLQTSVSPNIYSFGFNMLDNVVGGYSERAKKLRQAISIALDVEEYIAIFLNGRGIPAQGPIPPGIFGYQSGEKGIDPYVYEWKNNEAERKSIVVARKLLAEAGYPNGRDSKTGKPLILNYDTVANSSAEEKSESDWMREQFAKLGIQLNIRFTQYNRFQDKLRTGNIQIYFFGWSPDYPDPENFLFLFHGPQGKVKHGGENVSNYENPRYDALFNQMKSLPNNAERQKIIDEMLTILQEDSPWIWGFYPKSFLLGQSWVGPMNLDTMANNTLKYQWIYPEIRKKLQYEWNKPKIWPLILIILFLVANFIGILLTYRYKMQKPRVKRKSNV